MSTTSTAVVPATPGERVRAFRLALGLSQSKMSQRLPPGRGVDRVTLTMIEGGRNQLRSHQLRLKLAATMGLEPRDLDDYLDGNLALPAALRRSTAKPVKE